MKRPRSVYQYYVQQNMPAYQEKYPNSRGLQLIPMIATDYKNLSDQQYNFYAHRFFELKQKFLEQQERERHSEEEEGCETLQFVEIRIRKQSADIIMYN